MAWTGLALTVDGRNALNMAQMSGKLDIKSIVVGDGAPPANFSTQKALVHQLYEITDLRAEAGNGECTLTADIPQMEYDYYYREIGVMVNTGDGEKLYVYDNCGDSAQYIVSTTGVERTRKRIRLLLRISDVEEITVADAGILYVAYDEYEEKVERLEAGIRENRKSVDDHLNDTDNPHKTDKDQVGLGNADNTADRDKPVSMAQQAAMDALHEQLTAYTNQEIANLINGAPESLDTLKEVADAIAANKTIVDALDAAIGKKANAAEFDSHVKDTTKHTSAAERTKWNDADAKKHTHGNKSVLDGITSALVSGWSAKMEKTGDSANNVVTFTSGDAASPTGWADIGVVASGEKHSSLMRKFSLAVKNLRYLWKILGSTNLSGIGDGTVTGAINALNTGKFDQSGGTVNGRINAGGNVELWTDGEGGNVRIIGKYGTVWEIDAHNDDLRIFTYANGVKAGIAIGKSGTVHFPSGAADIDWEWIINKPDFGGVKIFKGHIGYGNSIYGTCVATSIGPDVYSIRIEAQQISQAAAASFTWGFNLFGILTGLGLNSSFPLRAAVWEAYTSAGALHTSAMGFGTGFSEELLTTGSVYRVLKPGRYYNVSGAYGGWDNHSPIGANGTFWKVSLVVG